MALARLVHEWKGVPCLLAPSTMTYSSSLEWSVPRICLLLLGPSHEKDAQRRYDMRHEMLTRCAPKRVMLSQHFMTHVVAPLGDVNYEQQRPDNHKIIYYLPTDGCVLYNL